ncbi:MAG TPA: glycosyltransferase, partial [Albitalea sp.]|nr:glycosyltransferase [Albitalea sp.]
ALLGQRVDGIVRPGLAPQFHPLAPQQAAAAREQLARRGIVPPYLLSVGTLEPRKNVALLLHAFLDLKRSGQLPGYQLVLAGARGWPNRGLERELVEARSQGVVVPGFVPDALMPALYGLSEALALPSIYEGFGMPALEARACGSRVIVADVPELREAAGPRAVVVDPTLPALRQGILDALATPRLQDSGLAEQHAWWRAAQRLARLLALPAPQTSPRAA